MERHGSKGNYNLQLERSLLGCILMDPALAGTMQFKSQWFYLPMHTQLYDAALKMSLSNEPVDPMTLSVKTKILVSDILDIIECKGSNKAVESYSESLHGLYTMREIVKACNRIIDLSDDDSEPSGALAIMNDTLTRLADSQTADEEHISDLMLSVLDSLIDSEGLVFGIPTGFKDLDALLNGWQRGQVSILAARPGVGKTALSLNFALAALEKDGCLFFSLEMTKDRIVKRLLSIPTSIPNSRIQKANLAASDVTKLNELMQYFDSRKLFIDSTPGLSPNMLKLKISKRAKDIGLVVIDYIQLMRNPRYGDNRVQEVSATIRDIQNAAKQFNVHIMVLAQLNRGVEDFKRKDDRTRLSDLKDSGEIEQVADIVLFIERDAYDTLNVCQVELNIAKNRHGPLGTVPLRMRKDCFRFEDM